MKGFLDLQKIFLPQSYLEYAYQSFRLAGKRKVEGVALFIGSKKETFFYIEGVVIPEHISEAVEEGLFYAIGGDELYRLNLMLHAKGMKLIAQIHSHPHKAYHSEADDAYAVVTTVGGLSIVVPEFGIGSASLNHCAIFRMSENNRWLKLSPKQIDDLISVT